MEDRKYNLIVKDYLDTIKNLDPDMSKQMKSHYKKQFIQITEGESSENLLFKLCKKISDLENYDIVCMGDTHEHQFLGEKKNIGYPSSLIQQKVLGLFNLKVGILMYLFIFQPFNVQALTV